MIEITGGVPDSWKLITMRFHQYMYEPDEKSFVFEAENSETDELWYVVFSGVSRITSKVPAFSTSELAIENAQGEQYSVVINGKKTGLVFNSAKILSESEFELFEDALPDVKESEILSCLDK